MKLTEFERTEVFSNLWLQAFRVNLKFSLPQGKLTYSPDSTKSKYNLGMVVFYASEQVKNEEMKYRMPIFKCLHSQKSQAV